MLGNLAMLRLKTYYKNALTGIPSCTPWGNLSHKGKPKVQWRNFWASFYIKNTSGMCAQARNKQEEEEEEDPRTDPRTRRMRIRGGGLEEEDYRSRNGIGGLEEEQQEED